jgi:hypothetical protein
MPTYGQDLKVKRIGAENFPHIQGRDQVQSPTFLEKYKNRDITANIILGWNK